MTLILFGMLGARAIVAEPPERVVVVSLDGLRADAVTEGLMPFVHGLLERSTYTLTAQSLPPTFTVPNHVSMVTGLTPATHGVLELSDTTGIIVDGTVFELAHDAGLTVGVYVSKQKLQLFNKPGTNDGFELTHTGYCAALVDGFLEDLADPERRWQLAFVHLVDLDTIGHSKGWMSPEYLAGVRVIDEHVRTIFEGVEAAGLLDETAILVLSDHGGLGLNHAADAPEVKNVPWIVTGPGVPEGQSIPHAVLMHDTAPTILRLLGLPVPEPMEGVTVYEVFGETGTVFLRGDADSSGRVNLTDAIAILQNLFLGGRATCELAADADHNASVNLTDAIFLLNHLFVGGPPPGAPYPRCGIAEGKPVDLPCEVPCR